MAGIIYGLCTATAALCAVLLLRSYFITGSRLLLWSGLCFVGLGFNNFFLILDNLVFPSVDLHLLRLLPALAGMILLIYGLVCEGE